MARASAWRSSSDDQARHRHGRESEPACLPSPTIRHGPWVASAGLARDVGYLLAQVPLESRGLDGGTDHPSTSHRHPRDESALATATPRHLAGQRGAALRARPLPSTTRRRFPESVGRPPARHREASARDASVLEAVLAWLLRGQALRGRRKPCTTRSFHGACGCLHLSHRSEADLDFPEHVARREDVRVGGRRVEVAIRQVVDAKRQ